MELSERHKELFRKLFSGTLDESEMDEVRQLISKPEMHAAFEEMMDEQGGLARADGIEETRFPTHQLAKFKKRYGITDHNRGLIPSVRWRSLAGYAAAILLMALGAVMYLELQGTFDKAGNQLDELAVQTEYREQVNKPGQRATVTLSDGTRVALGPGSRLRYPQRFDPAEREVFLEGEAYFEVIHNPHHPFTVHSGDLHTKVLGTSFKVDAYQDEAIEVSLVTGKVRIDRHVGSKQDSLVVLSPGQRMVWKDQSLSITTFEPLQVLAWKSGKLVFHQKPLAEIFKDLQRWYGVEISGKVRNSLLNESFTVTLDGNASLSKSMKVLAATADFSYEMNEKNIIISN